METKFTKGEWFLKDRSGGYRIKDNEQRDVCDIYSFASSISDEEAEANAKLIAACPIMYEYIYKKAQLGDNDAKLILAAIE